MAVDTDSCFAACRVIICMNAEASESPLAPEAPKTVVGTLRLANASAQTQHAGLYESQNSVLHLIRHTVATRLVTSGVDLKPRVMFWATRM